MSNQPYTLRWGILGPGDIARAFGLDILLDPSTRGVKGLQHTVVAAASRSQERAQSFLESIKAGTSAKGYGSYAELVADESVDIVYIGTPHSHHFQHAMLCLEAGKAVLCEKPITVNAAQLETLITKAKEKNLFLMEAAWTRYMPVARYVQEVIDSGKVGTVHRVFADLSNAMPPGTIPDDHRLLNPNLAGGVLLDIGVYALTWVFMGLYNDGDKVDMASSAVERYRTGVDAQTSFVVRFPRKDGIAAHGVVSTSMMVAGSDPGVRIQGSKGEIQVLQPIYRPEKTRVLFNDGSVEEQDWQQPGPGSGSNWFNGFRNEFGGGFHAESEGHGMFWEADECARAMRDAKLESSLHSLGESLALMRVIDEVRKAHSIEFPERVETTKHPYEG